MEPFGLKKLIGYGEEEYYRKFGEVRISQTCRRLERQKVDLSDIE
jgi:hypothetical protein